MSNDLKCSNLDCNAVINIENRDEGAKLVYPENEYGLLCDSCKSLIVDHLHTIAECRNCGRLTKIFTSVSDSVEKKYFSESCRACGGSEQDESILKS